jgi:hypothetical protein
VWRINSPKPVMVYLPVLEGTIDLRMAQLFKDKSETASLVLDGELPEEMVEEIDVFKFMKGVKSDSLKNNTVVDEAELKSRWAALAMRLRKASNRRSSAGRSQIAGAA